MRRVLAAAIGFVAAVALSACGGAAGTGSLPQGGGDGKKLVVWDWKSGDATTAGYFDAARAAFAAQHPDTEVEFVAQPYEQYYTLLGTAIEAGQGPDVVLFNGGGQIRDRADALVPLDPYLGAEKQRLTGWDAFRSGDATLAAPVTLQGMPIYYNKALYRQAGLDPEHPPTTFAELQASCATLEERTGTSCFAAGNKEGYGIQFFMSAFGPGILTPQEYDAWLAGDRDWSSPNVKRIFELWKQFEDAGYNNPGVNSTALFNDAFSVFSAGRAAHVIGLISDVGNWKDLGEFLGADLGVTVAPTITDGAAPALAFDGGIGYGVTEWTADPALAADLVKALTDPQALHAFYTGAGAVPSDPGVDTSDAGPVLGRLVADLPTGKPALHLALSASTQDLMGRLSQELLSGSVTVDDAVRQLAAADAA
jgi:multiple sugar transport system substrate-binding protein